ncbi:MAG TPA: carbon storage regulator [Phycisphaerae bacterium]|nr:carbon storage regulator [Phycisphaerae bacterium]
MLALSRAEGQSIIINGTIEVKVVKWSRSSVRLAIQAPREVSVDRDEIWRRIHPGAKSPLELAEMERQVRFQSGGAATPVQTEVINLGDQPAGKTSLEAQKIKH